MRETDSEVPAPGPILKRWMQDSPRTSQTQLAELSGVPQATIQRILSGEARDPRYNTVKRLVEALGHSMEELAGYAPSITSARESGLLDEQLQCWRHRGLTPDQIDAIEQVVTAMLRSNER